jgi:hypothetical protein
MTNLEILLSFLLFVLEVYIRASGDHVDDPEGWEISALL